MERYLKIVIFFLCSLKMIGCTSSKKSAQKTKVNKLNSINSHHVKKITVLVRNNTDEYISYNILNSISNLFSLSALKKGYSVATPKETKEVKKKIQFESSHWDRNDVSNLGHFHNINALLIININQSSYINNQLFVPDFFNDIRGGFEYSTATYTSSIAVNLISAKNNKILWANNFKDSIISNTKSMKELPIITLARKIASKIPNRVN